MNKYFWLLVIILGTTFALSGCAALTGVPQGSVLLGVYEGSFDGKFDWGTIEVKLYQSPGGAKIFTGAFMEGAEFPANFNGQMNEGKMQGALIGYLDGTVSGRTVRRCQVDVGDLQDQRPALRPRHLESPEAVGPLPRMSFSRFPSRGY